jgi:hypothetical protein
MTLSDVIEWLEAMLLLYSMIALAMIVLILALRLFGRGNKKE